MPNDWKIVLGILTVAVLIGLASLGRLHQRMKTLSENPHADEQARREVMAAPVATPTDVTVQAKMYWQSGQDQLAPVAIKLPLSADPVERSKQVLDGLITQPTPQQHTLPSDTTVLGFYVLPDGTAIADFSDALATETPSGIASEQTAVDSIVDTLKADVPSLQRLKILIHGQEVDTLAGHVDLTGFFDLNSAPAQPSIVPTQSGSISSTGSAAPVQKTVAPTALPHGS
ncbi:MAG TPA: GerMN domain-containing protein [Candidatus Acidoferrales bacterium]|nr:GerMN domain-containing protein [Candidatus Acidoferrales bacterium]